MNYSDWALTRSTHTLRLAFFCLWLAFLVCDWRFLFVAGVFCYFVCMRGRYTLWLHSPACLLVCLKVRSSLTVTAVPPHACLLACLSAGVTTSKQISLQIWLSQNDCGCDPVFISGGGGGVFLSNYCFLFVVGVFFVVRYIYIYMCRFLVGCVYCLCCLLHVLCCCKLSWYIEIASWFPPYRRCLMLVEC